MQEVIMGVLCAFLSFLILYFVIKGAVRAGIKEAYGDLSVYLRLMVTAGIKEANEDNEQKKEN